MKHQALNDETREIITLYALGSLPQQDARHYEQHLSEGCEVCQAELEAVTPILACIGLSASEEEPPPGVRERLLASFSKESEATGKAPARKAARSEIISIRTTEGRWKEISDGVMAKLLYVDRAGGTVTSLVKMLPGTHLPPHRHKGVEQFFILEGDCRIHDEVLGPGDYHRAEAGTIHRSTYTESGTMFLLIAPESYDILNAQ